MVYRPATDPTLCFVLMPFRDKFNEYYKEIIKPAAKDAGLVALRSDEIYGTKPVIRDIWEQIWKARAVIADVTEKNPNVNYELGICHSLGVPTVLITQSLGDVPFDYQHRRCILYDTTRPRWDERLWHDITETLKAVLAEPVEMEELRWPYDTNALRSKLQATPLWSSPDAIDVVIAGARSVSNALGTSFGPNGILVSVRDSSGGQRQVKDGGAIAAAVRSGDPLEAAGIKQIQSLIADTYAAVGDFTKTAALICERLLIGGRQAQKAGSDVASIVSDINSTVELALSALRKRAVPVAGPAVITNVATTAACGDSVAAMLITEAFKRAGKDGLIYTEPSPFEETQLEAVEGMYFDRGYIDEGFVTHEATGACILSDCHVLMYESKLTTMRDFLPVLEQVARANRSILVIADDVEAEVLSTMLLNKRRGTLQCAAVKAPGHSDRRRAMLEDIAILTGGTAITTVSGRTLSSITIEDLGKAKEVVITRTDTSIRGGAGDPEVISSRVTALRKAIERSGDHFEREKLQERLAKLSGAAVAIRVGGRTNTDVHYRQYRINSALHSSRIAVEAGCVEGGGVALHSVRVSMENAATGISAGRAVVFDALDAPLQQILRAAGSSTEIKLEDGRGFDLRTRQVLNMREAGILDPVDSLCKAVEIASVYATTMLQTGAWDLTEPCTSPDSR